MTASDTAFWITIVTLAYLVAPAMLIWGWMRWRGQPKQRTVASRLTFYGFTLATASACLGLCTILLAGALPMPASSSLLLRRTIQLGGALSSAGLILSLAGIWRKSPTRWQAPASSIGTLAFWLMIAILAVDD